MARMFPTLILASLIILLVDNFTYTVANKGIALTDGVWRGMYAFMFLGIFALIYWWINRFLRSKTKTKDLKDLLLVSIVIGLLVFSGFYSVSSFIDVTSTSHIVGNLRSVDQIDRPHIILLGSDGLNSAHMSMYGYERDTTPNLRVFAKEFLIVENAFPNATTSLGSITSMLTGKLPTETRVLYRPDLLVGIDAFQHWPGILKDQGYETVEISFPYYADAYEANIRGGFDQVNNRSMESNPTLQLAWRLGGDYTAFFMATMFDRISSRLLHVFYIETMVDPYASVTTLPGERMGDRERIDQLLSLIDNAEGPLFVHVHLMGTHGPNFNPRKQVYSLGKSQDEAFMIDFYDDAVLDFDAYIGEVVDHLTLRGILDLTILVIYTDHGMKYTTNDRIPLLFRFPYGQYSGKLSNNVQNLDIPVTILDYLELQIPNWMGGVSLLAGEPPPLRFIYSAGPAFLTLVESNIGGLDVELWSIDLDKVAPPFYQFGKKMIVVCQKWYRIDLINYVWGVGEIAGHTSPCEEETMPTMEEVQKEMLQHLMMNRFDINSLEEAIIGSVR